MAAIPEATSPTVEAIYKTYEERRRTWSSPRLPLSSIGDECERSLWYGFRWSSPPAVLNGRKLRLFKTGDREEERLIADLRDAGIEVIDRDPETGKQWDVSAADGHAGGRLDGVVFGVLESPNKWHLLEAKSHAEKYFKQLKKDGVQKAFPKHYAQVQIYMDLASLDRCLYIACCKNTDEIYVERIKPDKALALRLIAKVQRIIKAPVPPPRISEDPTYYLCRFCDHSAICHDSGWAPRNCRTCLHATPVEDGKWHCALQDRHLSRDEQRAGCLLHLMIPALVPGEQVDATDRTVTYRLRDGTEWVDGEEMA